jgi:hypothetical protein
LIGNQRPDNTQPLLFSFPRFGFLFKTESISQAKKYKRRHTEHNPHCRFLHATTFSKKMLNYFKVLCRIKKVLYFNVQNLKVHLFDEHGRTRITPVFRRVLAFRENMFKI